MTVISEDGPAGSSLGSGSRICLYRAGHVQATRVKPDDVVALRADAREIRADGGGCTGIEGPVCGTANATMAKAAVPNMAGGLAVECVTHNTHVGFPDTIGVAESGGGQAPRGGFVLDAGNGTVLEKLS